MSTNNAGNNTTTATDMNSAMFDLNNGRPTIGSTFTNILGATNSLINAVNNTAKTVENVTGVMADKSENFRETSKIADTIKHNQMLDLLNKQAAALGIDV
jgi:hypothetical protein